MSLEGRPLKFSSITNHASVTQCLGSIGGHVWYLGVAKSSRVDSSEDKGNKGSKVVQAHSGHSYVPPAIEDVRVFRFSGPKFVKLNVGTRHAGPLFKPHELDFYNLEQSNTNMNLAIARFGGLDLCGNFQNIVSPNKYNSIYYSNKNSPISATCYCAQAVVDHTTHCFFKKDDKVMFTFDE